VAYSPHPTRAAKVPLIIQSGSQTTRIAFDQTQPLPPGEAFRSAGVVQLASDQDNIITLSNTGTEGFVILDAIQLLEVKN
jgi:hypothetical protein